MTLEQTLIILYIFAGLIIALLLIIIFQKVNNAQTNARHGRARDFMMKRYFDHEKVKMSVSSRFFFNAFYEVETQIQIEPEIREEIVLDLMQTKFFALQVRHLHHRNKYKRKMATYYLGSLRHPEICPLLKKQFYQEKNDSVRFQILYYLIDFIDQPMFDYLIKTLRYNRSKYPVWVFSLVKNHFNLLKPFIMYYWESKDKNVEDLFIYLANAIYDADLKKYALMVSKNTQTDLDFRLKAIDALATNYPETLFDRYYLGHPEIKIQQKAIRSLSSNHELSTVNYLIDTLDGTMLDQERIQSLSRIIFDAKNLLLYTFDCYKTLDKKDQKLGVARVLSHHLEYLVLKIKTEDYPVITSIIDHMLELRIVENIIDFLNQNKDVNIERFILVSIKKYASMDTFYMDQFTIYLKEDILRKIGLIKKAQPVIPREKSPRELNKIIWILVWISVGIILIPLLVIVTKFNLLIAEGNFFVNWLVSINQYVVIYFLTINSIYLALLVFSLIGAEQSINMWDIKKSNFLFERDLLPSISIIAPAYNEEKSIIESVTSLLNLKYPKYEVVVVNDGSKDQTIQVLIDHFKLERKHPFFAMPLQTKPLRGVYVSNSIPNLIVIDKVNGGKADALNLGINVAKYEFICGIDADSLLEEEALLRLMSSTLDDSREHIALGGNIVPVNGCTVDRGKVEKTGLGDKAVVRFQTLEYLRAFTTGRIGWSKLNSLLIISGAFGLFSRNSLIETGGYLTISGQLKKDTVGEDMELVVRLTYQALREKRPYRVKYVHHAQCYTELPSDMRSLLKQRNRWQRGLLDILSYHRRILFNPRYKQPGLIGFPYFFFFEMIGPFIEAVSYLAIILSLIFGLLNLPMAILMVVSTILYGILISLFSLYITERRSSFFSFKETLLMMFLAIIENFGYRQIVSLHRVISTFSALKESGTWGSQNRQGFTKK